MNSIERGICVCYYFRTMREFSCSLFLFFALVVPALPASAQKFQPKTIQFQGVPEYTDDELLTAANLKKGAIYTAAEMQEHTNLLSNSGVFAGIKFTFNGQDLIFQLTPATDLYPLRLDNLPLTPGPDLDAKIHASQPLYRGKIPMEGTLLDGVKTVLAEQLAALGIKATLATAPYAIKGAQTASAIAVSIASPPILVGEIQPGDAPALESKAQAALTSITGKPYSLEGTPDAIVKDLSEVYGSMGYLDVDVKAARLDSLVVVPDAVRVPFRFSLYPGPVYKVTAIQLAPDMLVSQADFDKQSHVHPGDVADAVHIAENWHFIERQYHNKGYMKARVTPQATLDKAQHAVSYAVSATPGPVYTMGNLSVENVSDEIRSMMLAAWKMPAGAVFNEGTIISYYAIDATDKSADPRLFRLFHSVNCKYTLKLNDDAKTVDVILRLEKRAS